MEDILRYSPLYEAQHGYTKKKSTESAAASVVNYVEKYIYNKQYSIGVFLDISSAFDTIKPDFIKTELGKFTMNQDLVDWYYNYLIHRDLEFAIQGHKTTISNSMGFPQGGVASAKLWTLAFNEAI